MDFGGRPAILFLGRLERRKGVEVLVQAVSTVSDLNPLLIVAGTGPRENSARTLARRLGVEAHFLGSLDDHNVAAVYRGADVYCAPNLGGESFGIVLLEAMAAGTPVLASQIPGYASVVTSESDGLLVPPKDEAALAATLQRLASQPDLRRELGRRGQLTAVRYDWPLIAGRVLGYYERLLSEARPVRQPIRLRPRFRYLRVLRG